MTHVNDGLPDIGLVHECRKYDYSIHEIVFATSDGVAQTFVVGFHHVSISFTHSVNDHSKHGVTSVDARKKSTQNVVLACLHCCLCQCVVVVVYSC